MHAQYHNIQHIYFGGSFIRGHHQTMHTLSFGMRYWSKGSKKAYFLRHEGYLGAVGAFLRRQPKNWYCWPPSPLFYTNAVANSPCRGRRNSAGVRAAGPAHRRAGSI